MRMRPDATRFGWPPARRRPWLLALPVGVLVACAPPRTATSACPVAPLRPTPGPGAIDALMETHLRDGLAGRPVPPADVRQAARRDIVVACLRAHADTIPPQEPFESAVTAVTEACGPVIHRYLQAEGMEAVLQGDRPAGPGEMAAMRDGLRSEAASRIRGRRAGRCKP